MTATALIPVEEPTGWSKDVLRIGFGVIWAIDASLKWLPGFRSGFAGMLTGLAAGQPGWLRPWFDLWDGMGHPEAQLLAYLVALTESYIAVAVIVGFARKVTYILAACYALMIWATAEGFGGPYKSGATDIGTGVIYSVVFVGLLVLAAYTGPDRHSVDYYLERRIPWWWRIAEIRKPATATIDLRTAEASNRPLQQPYVGTGRQVSAGDVPR